jgi:hypothetical protein
MVASSAMVDVVVAAVVVVVDGAVVEVVLGAVAVAVVEGGRDDVVGSPSGSALQAASRQTMTINWRRIETRVFPISANIVRAFA